MHINLFKIKEGKVDIWKDWCLRLNTVYREEAIDTLKEENLSYEAFAIFSINGTFYTFGIAEGEAKPANLDKKINQEHRAKKKECLEKVGPVEVLYELYNKV